MTDKLHCPFCGKEFREIYFNGVGVGYICPNPDCKLTEHFKGNKELWQALIDTKEERDKFEEHYKCLSRALAKGEIPKFQADMFLLGYYYFGMRSHLSSTEDAGWYAEGVDFYMNELLKDYQNNEEVKKFIKIIKTSKD